MKKLLQRNYDAVVKRGLINNRTIDSAFLLKLNEEAKECYDAIKSNNYTNLNEEIADCLIVCTNWLIHRGIDIEKLLTEIAEKNEKRALIQK